MKQNNYNYFFNFNCLKAYYKFRRMNLINAFQKLIISMQNIELLNCFLRYLLPSIEGGIIEYKNLHILQKNSINISLFSAE